MIRQQLIHSFTHAALSPDPDLAVAALMIARVEYPRLDAGPYLDRLDALGREAARRVAEASPVPGQAPPHVDPAHYARVMALNTYLFEEQRFVGNERRFDDPRNSFLNEVLDRRTGIPITLALLFMEVARRAGVRAEGINFPGRFLLRCRADRSVTASDDLILDAFHGGAVLSKATCREMLRGYTDVDLPDDPDGDDARLESRLFAHATKPQILVRMLLNLKHVYVNMYSFPQARDITELLLAVDPSAINELRDRGLLAYQLRDFAGALRDLQAYLRLSNAARDDHDTIWEHVKTLRRRVASLN
jgi:regulator of sirC expression with transglutaminase-like and TPR domain